MPYQESTEEKFERWEREAQEYDERDRQETIGYVDTGDDEGQCQGCEGRGCWLCD